MFLWLHSTRIALQRNQNFQPIPLACVDGRTGAHLVPTIKWQALSLICAYALRVTQMRSLRTACGAETGLPALPEVIQLTKARYRHEHGHRQD